MVRSKARLGDLLLSRKLITPEHLEKALAHQLKDPSPLGQILIQLGFLKEHELLAVLAEQKGARPWDLVDNPPDPQALSKLPAKICKEHRILPVAQNGPVLVVAMMDPENLDTIDLIHAYTRLKVLAVYALDTHLVRAIESLQDENAQGHRVDVLVDMAMVERQTDHPEQVSAETQYDERPVVLLIDQILNEAVSLRASDIHFEPQRGRVDLRYRIDGHIRIARQLPKALTAQIVSRLKVMSQLDLIEFRMPQDGRFDLNCQGRKVDFRVNVLPTHHGPRVVMRVLDRASSVRYLDSIGMTDDCLTQYRRMIAKPYGLVLVTGPSGSGKTTTLYGTLNELKEFRGNVMTCEDPIEYEVDGISQSQVNEKNGLTFASHIRAVMRQDPDVILVGEIRDKETAETAIRAALTGHLVLSTLHANDAPSAIPRLMDLGVDPRLLSSSLIGVTAQRLVRTLCSCHTVEESGEDDLGRLEYIGASPMTHTRRAKGCRKCGLTGFFGRTGVHEILAVDGEVASWFEAPNARQAIAESGRRLGYVPMQERAIDLVYQGVTIPEEVMSVIAFGSEKGQPAAPRLEDPNEVWRRAMEQALKAA